MCIGVHGRCCLGVHLPTSLRQLEDAIGPPGHGRSARDQFGVDLVAAPVRGGLAPLCCDGELIGEVYGGRLIDVDYVAT